MKSQCLKLGDSYPSLKVLRLSLSPYHKWRLTPLKKNCDQSQPNSRELLRDFERVSYNFKDLQRVLHNWEPKLKSVGGAVMEHRGVLESVLHEIAKLQYLFTKTWQALEVSQGQVAA